MRKFQLIALAAVVLSLCIAVPAQAQCVKIQSGTLFYSAGSYLTSPIKVGFDAYGYNYQAHQFNGSYANVYLNRDGFPAYEGDDTAYYALLTPAQVIAVQGKWYWPYRDVSLVMKWNDAWLSNQDCDGDGKLDRHYGFTGYIGSGAWETNHQSGVVDGQPWSDFVKIVAVPTDAVKITVVTVPTWFSADGKEIGPDIWGEFAIVQEIYNDPSNGAHGVLYKSRVNPGLGFYK